MRFNNLEKQRIDKKTCLSDVDICIFIPCKEMYYMQRNVLHVS